MANRKGNSTKGYSMTHLQAESKFGNGIEFEFKRTGLRAKNMYFDLSNKVSVEVRSDVGSEWEMISLSFPAFLKDQPELIESNN